MMKTYRTMAGLLALTLLSASCSRQSNGSDGRISFSVNADAQVTAVTRSNVSDYTESIPDAGDFNIVVTNSSGSEIFNGNLKDYDTQTTLKVGNYSVKASYGSLTDEGFDKPCFSGEKTFAVTGGSTTNVTIPVTLANCIVRIECTDIFKAYYTDYTFTVKTGGGTEISFPKGTEQAAFVDAYYITVSGTLTNQAGKEKTFSKEYRSLSPKTCYTIGFNASNVGGSSVTITFDGSVEDVNLDEVELNK